MDGPGGLHSNIHEQQTMWRLMNNKVTVDLLGKSYPRESVANMLLEKTHGECIFFQLNDGYTLAETIFFRSNWSVVHGMIHLMFPINPCDQ